LDDWENEIADQEAQPIDPNTLQNASRTRADLTGRVRRWRDCEWEQSTAPLADEWLRTFSSQALISANAGQVSNLPVRLAHRTAVHRVSSP